MKSYNLLIQRQIELLTAKKEPEFDPAKIITLTGLFLIAKSVQELRLGLEQHFSHKLRSKLGPDLEVIYQIFGSGSPVGININAYLKFKEFYPDERNEFLQKLRLALETQSNELFESCLKHLSTRNAGIMREDLGCIFTDEPVRPMIPQNPHRSQTRSPSSNSNFEQPTPEGLGKRQSQKKRGPAIVLKLIESFLDSGNDYQIQKCKLLIDQVNRLLGGDTSQMMVCGFYGELEGTIDKASRFLEADINSAAFGEIQNTSIALFAAQKDSKIALILHCHEDMFLNQFDKKSPVVDFMRYLMDICNSVVMSLPKHTDILVGEPLLHYQADYSERMVYKEVNLNNNISLTDLGLKVRSHKLVDYSMVWTDSPNLFNASMTYRPRVPPLHNGRSYESVCSQIADQLRGRSRMVKRVWEDLRPYCPEGANLPIEGISDDIFVSRLAKPGTVTWEWLKSTLDVCVYKTVTNLKIELARLNFLKELEGRLVQADLVQDNLALQIDLDTVAELRVVDFVPLTEETGVFMVQNYPPEKTTLFSYSHTLTVKRVVEIGTYPSADCRMVINRKAALYFIYNSVHMRGDMGHIKQNQKMEEGKHVPLGDKMKGIVSATILTCNENLLILDEDGQLFKFVHSTGTLTKEVSIDTNSRNPVSIRPANRAQKYVQVQSHSTGRLIYMLWKDGLDIYDLNYEKIKELPLAAGFRSFKSVLDQKYGFEVLLFQFDRNIEVKLITGVQAANEVEFVSCDSLHGCEGLATSELLMNSDYREASQQPKSLVTNPFLDYWYIASDKFGAPVAEIGCSDYGAVKLICTSKFDNAFAYWQKLKVPYMALSDELDEEIVRSITSQKLRFLLLSRIPIHIASIQKFTLMPLSDGEYNSNKFFDMLHQNDDGKSQITKICNSIRFGHLEDFIRDWTGPISVVSMIGKQSSGKSYLLNRMFGTRFNVAGTRCTDGIWMSISMVNDQSGNQRLLVILDCEGLFSIVRSPTEETKLCLALVAISDILIINQDLSFNRHINQMISSLKDSLQKLRGKQLFQVVGDYLIRDVAVFQDANQEFKANMRALSHDPDSFVHTIFKGNMLFHPLPYFGMNTFPETISKAKADHVRVLSGTVFNPKPKRWESGEDFLLTTKIVLAQLMIDDDINLDEHKANIRVNEFYSKATEIYHEGKGHPILQKALTFSTIKPSEHPPIDMRVELVGQRALNSAADRSIRFCFKHSEIPLPEQDREIANPDYSHLASSSIFLEEQMIENKPKYLDQFPYPKLLAQLTDCIGEYSLRYHDRWIQEVNQILTYFFDSREKIVRDHFDELFNGKSIELREIKRRELEAHLKRHRKLTKICAKSCRKCARSCFELEDHIDDCNCDTDHNCISNCQIEPDCSRNSRICTRLFGHEGAHDCGNKHRCSEKCSMASCSNSCQLNPGHSELQHDCRSKHPCTEKCSQENCQRSCTHDSSVAHSVHKCDETQCVQKCQFCEERCCEGCHFHSETLKNGLENVLDHHNCGKKDHSCPGKCEVQGICNIRYEPHDRTVKKGEGDIKYTFLKPIQSRGTCSKTISKLKKSHDEGCKCTMEAHDHRCDQQCPDCQSFCTKPYGHIGKHSTASHRNKDLCRFVSVNPSGTIAIQTEDGQRRYYNPGDSCEPEECSQSCKRKFRSHFHLKECPGPEKCPQKTHPRVTHCEERYHPFEDKVFDKWLCGDYWDTLGWEVPVNAEIARTNNLCNAFCSACQTQKSEMPTVFCELNALHEGPHEINCEHAKAASNGKCQIAFVQDSTGSMDPYIAAARETIKVLVEKFKKAGSKMELEFGCVDYKDHQQESPEQGNSYVTNVKDFSSETVMMEYLGNLKASGGWDFPEAFIDGLHDAVDKLTWKPDFQKFIFHITDAPPHGLQYNSLKDDFPDGCPCGKTIEPIARSIADKKIKYYLLPFGPHLNITNEILKSKIPSYSCHPIASADEIQIHVQNLLIETLVMPEMDVNGDARPA